MITKCMLRAGQGPSSSSSSAPTTASSSSSTATAAAAASSTINITRIFKSSPSSSVIKQSPSTMLHTDSNCGSEYSDSGSSSVSSVDDIGSSASSLASLSTSSARMMLPQAAVRNAGTGFAQIRMGSGGGGIGGMESTVNGVGVMATLMETDDHSGRANYATQHFRPMFITLTFDPLSRSIGVVFPASLATAANRRDDHDSHSESPARGQRPPQQ